MCIWPSLTIYDPRLKFFYLFDLLFLFLYFHPFILILFKSSYFYSSISIFFISILLLLSYLNPFISIFLFLLFYLLPFTFIILFSSFYFYPSIYFLLFPSFFFYLSLFVSYTLNFKENSLFTEPLNFFIACYSWDEYNNQCNDKFGSL